MQQNEALKQREERFREFMEVSFQLTERELQAIHGLIPMTQELFSQCMRKCEEIGATGQMAELIAGFPTQHRTYCEGREVREGEIIAGIPYVEQNAWTPGTESLQTDAIWQKIRAQLARNAEDMI